MQKAKAHPVQKSDVLPGISKTISCHGLKASNAKGVAHDGNPKSGTLERVHPTPDRSARQEAGGGRAWGVRAAHARRRLGGPCNTPPQKYVDV